MNNADKQAYPLAIESSYSIGLTKREQFAAMAMQGLLSMMANVDSSLIISENVSINSIELADALLKALEEK